MRPFAYAFLLSLALTPVRAESPREVLDCRDYMVRFDEMMKEVAARAPGNETDARREKAESLVRDCKREERREARQAAEDSQVLVPVPYPVPVPTDCVRNGVRVLCESVDQPLGRYPSR